jgi:hypothetical protein
MGLFPFLLVVVMMLHDASAACISVRDELTYCAGVISYLVDDDYNSTLYNATLNSSVLAREALAFAAYREDLEVWKRNKDIECPQQKYNKTMCSNCLAIRRRLHCTTFLPKCIDDATPHAPLCQALCQEVGLRCPKVPGAVSCDALPSEDCSPATAVRVSMWTTSLAVIAAVVLLS